MLVVIIAGVIAAGGVGYSIYSGIIYLGPNVPGFEITGGNATDAGIAVHFGVNLSSAPASTLSYEWFGNGQIGYSENFSTSFKTPGIYDVSLTISMSDDHTKRTQQIEETVHSDPMVTIAENKNVIDAGQNISLSSTITGGIGPFSYAWSFNTSLNISDPNVAFYFILPPPPPFAGGIQLAIMDSVGYTTFSNSLYPTINGIPYVYASSNTTFTDIGTPVTLTATAYSGTPPYAYSWTWEGNVISTSQSFSYAFSQSGNQTVDVKITDSVGIAATDSVSIDVSSDPMVSVSTYWQNALSGTNIGFSACVNNGAYPFTYQWYVDGNSVGGNHSIMDYTFSTAGSYTIKVVVMERAGQSCSSTMTERIK
jgi:hypothetical protein